MTDPNEAVLHLWAGDDEGHNCTSCAPDSVWRCDRAAHYVPRPTLPAAIKAALRRHALGRVLASRNGRLS